ncbi:MAG: isoaspartyl peptidase [Bacteroidetes bacterium]|jgi:beta-aspartyl-peptidase (threonine type)|nr:isoaspartyl peptidase [Bacteroidota bacterium]
MTKNISFIFLILFIQNSVFSQQKPQKQNVNFALAIHGGAGTILKKNMTPELEKEYTDKLNEALQKGYDTLSKGGSSLDAVIVSIKILEDSPLFNAGKGSVFTADGKNEMDASIMDGKTLMAGSVAGVRKIKNPITAARCVMEKSQHVMMVGNGAEQFAVQCKCDFADSAYFFDQKRWNQFQKIKEKELNKPVLDTTGSIKPSEVFFKDEKFGTVGLVALDKYGNLAAGTSTGGMTNKKYGRVGDSPIIGAGTYANNKTCAVSCTGHGEFFIRSVVAYDVSALMEYKGLSLADAANEVIMKKLVSLGAEGGLIAIDAKGNITMPFNSAGMYRGYMKSDGKKEILIYR